MKGSQKPGVVFQPHVHQALQRGIGQMVSLLRPTLGPVSGGVAIDHLNKTKILPEFLDDGGVIARRIIELRNRDEDMGAMLVRSMVIRQHERIGDGTVTAAILFEAVFNAGLRYIAAGGNAMLLRRNLENALPLILASLDNMVSHLSGQTALTHMARSLCHDNELAEHLGAAFDLLGEYGRLEVREDYGREIRREDVEGNYFYSGMFARSLAADEVAGYSSVENPAIFLCDFEVDDHRELFPVLQTAHAAGVKNLVIIARNLSEKAISLLVTNNNMGKFRATAVKLPGLNPDDRMAALDDIQAMTGAKPFLKITGDSLENVKFNDFGSARRLWADLHAFGLVGGRGNPRALREHVRRLKAAHHRALEPEARKTLLARIGNLMGRSIILRAGGFAKNEIKARKNLADRTASALRVALEEGVVPGGGMALFHCRTALSECLSIVQDTDARAAYRILIEAMAAPARAILCNAGYEPGEVFAQLDANCVASGFDVAQRRVVNLRDAGIVDSLSVVKASVRNAITSAALALTIDSLVHLAKPEMTGNPE